MAAPPGLRLTGKDLALAAGALLVIGLSAALRLQEIAVAPITDPLEAREFQLARILVEQGWGAFATAADPVETGRIGAVLPVALAGWIAGGFEAFLPLRLPALAALLVASWAAWRAGLVLTGRRGPALAAAAALFATPSTGLVALSSTADALTLLLLALSTACLARLLRWGGDSRMAVANGQPYDEVLYLPPGDLRADRPWERSDPEAAGRNLRRSLRRDRQAAAVFWVGLGLSAHVAGGALAAFALAAILATRMVLGIRLLRRHRGAEAWRSGRFRTLAGLPAALALGLLPSVLLALWRGGFDDGLVTAFVTPRADLSPFPATLLDGAGLLTLCWPLAALLPLWILSRVYFGAARESFVLLLLLGWVPGWLALGLPALALVFGSVGLGLGAGLMVNYWVEFERRPSMPVTPLKTTDLVPLACAGLVAAVAVLLIVLAFDASDGDLALVLLLGAILMLLPIAWFAIEQSASGLALSALALSALLEFVGTGLLMPAAHTVWPGWRTEAILAPFRSCGAWAIRDETGFDPGFPHHAGTGASAPGMAGHGLPALLLTADPAPPGPGWVTVAQIGYLGPDGDPLTAHVHADPAARPERQADPAWRACLRALALRD